MQHAFQADAFQKFIIHVCYLEMQLLRISYLQELMNYPSLKIVVYVQI